MRIAITGATGNIGNRLAHRLLEQGGHEITLLVRNPDKVADLTAQGATAQAGDVEDPEYLTSATQGVETLFLMIPPKYHADDFRAYQRQVVDNAVRAIEANGIGHVVLLSSVGAHLPDGTGPIAGLHIAEAALRKTGAKLTFLRPNYFMENFFWSLDSIASQDQMYLPVPGSSAFQMIATQDIAEAALQALTAPAPESPRVIELGGPSKVSLDEAATVIGAAIGKPVAHVEIPFEAAKAHLLSTGASENVADSFMEMYRWFGSGTAGYEHPEQVVQTPTSFETFTQIAIAPALQQQTTA